MEAIALEFSEIVEPLESIGRTYDNRDILMIKINASGHLGKKFQNFQKEEDRKAILLTGAHHSRELVSVQMPLYTVLKLIHGYLHQDPETIGLLERSKYFVIPMVNVDGSATI